MKRKDPFHSGAWNSGEPPLFMCLTHKWEDRTKRLCPNLDELTIYPVMGMAGVKSTNPGYPGNNAMAGYVNMARAIMETKWGCFCRPDNNKARWESFQEVIDWLCKQGAFSARPWDAQPVGDCAGLWTNQPERGPNGVVYGARLYETPAPGERLFWEHVWELVLVCSVLRTCAGGSPMMLGYKACTGNSTIWTMAPSGYRDKIAFCGGIGGGESPGFGSCGCAGMTGMASTYFQEGIPDTAYPMSGLIAAAAGGIKLLGKKCYYLKYLQPASQRNACSSSAFPLVRNSGEMADWTDYYAMYAGLPKNPLVMSYTDVTGFDPPITLCSDAQCTDCHVWKYLRCGVEEMQANSWDWIYYEERDTDPPAVLLPKAEDQPVVPKGWDEPENACFAYVETVDCKDGQNPKMEWKDVDSCEDTRCLCCPNLDKDMMDFVTEGITERILWLGGVDPAIPSAWSAEDESCEDQKALWLSICEAWDTQIHNFYAQITGAKAWVNTEVHPDADIEDAASVTYFLPGDFTSGDGGEEVEICKRLMDWMEVALVQVIRLQAVTVTGGAVSQQSHRKAGFGSTQAAAEAAFTAMIWSLYNASINVYEYSDGSGNYTWSGVRVRGKVGVTLTSYSTGSAKCYVLVGPYGYGYSNTECAPVTADGKFHTFGASSIGGVWTSDLINDINTPPSYTVGAPSLGAPYSTPRGWYVAAVLAVVKGDFIL